MARSSNCSDGLGFNGMVPLSHTQSVGEPVCCRSSAAATLHEIALLDGSVCPQLHFSVWAGVFEGEILR